MKFMDKLKFWAKRRVPDVLAVEIYPPDAMPKVMHNRRASDSVAEAPPIPVPAPPTIPVPAPPTINRAAATPHREARLKRLLAIKSPPPWVLHEIEELKRTD